MFGGFGFGGGWGYGGYGGYGHRPPSILTLILILAALGWNYGGWEIKTLVIAVPIVIGWAGGFLSVSYCLKVVPLIGAAVLLWGFNLIAVAAAIALASLWHWWSKGMSIPGRSAAGKSAARAAKRQNVFFDGIFSLLGYIAKADGVVCKREINFAAALMANMQLNEERRAHARELFRRGKDADFDIDKTLERVRKECKGSIEMFMRILSHAALINGEITDVERRILQYVGNRLGLSASEIEQIEAAVRSGESYSHSGQSQSYGGDESYNNRAATPRPGGLAEAYKILGVLSNASDSDIKKSYRRLMSRHHPDKLAAKGIPPEMMRVATERAQEISSAYERIKKARGI